MNEAVSLPKALWDTTLNKLVSRLGLSEIEGEDGGPFKTLVSQAPMFQGPCGNIRHFEGGPLHHLVTCSIVVPPIQLDSHMLFAFTKSDSPVPHFTLDSVKAGEFNAFHLDLIPRLDLGAELKYMNEVFVPLSEKCEEARNIEGMTKAHISPIQHAVMSPWMLVQRATDDAFKQMDQYVDHYLDHWISVLENGISDEAIGTNTPEDIKTRDARNKEMIFSPDIDPVWGQIEGLVGAETVAELRGILKSQSE